MQKVYTLATLGSLECNSKVSNLRSRGRGFDSRSGQHQVVTTWMGDCPRTRKPSR